MKTDQFDFSVNDGYSPRVLLGNWYEKRIDWIYPKSRVIACTGECFKCPESLTTYQMDFKRTTPKRINQDFEKMRLQAYMRKMDNLESNVQLLDSCDFMDNYTTTNKVTYQLIPERYQSKPWRRAKLGGKPIEEDLMQCYGSRNHNNYGLREYVNWRRVPNVCLPNDVTTYAEHYQYPMRCKDDKDKAKDGKEPPPTREQIEFCFGCDKHLNSLESIYEYDAK